jgi:hypothetical protein
MTAQPRAPNIHPVNPPVSPLSFPIPSTAVEFALDRLLFKHDRCIKFV